MPQPSLDSFAHHVQSDGNDYSSKEIESCKEHDAACTLLVDLELHSRHFLILAKLHHIGKSAFTVLEASTHELLVEKAIP